MGTGPGGEKPPGPVPIGLNLKRETQNRPLSPSKRRQRTVPCLPINDPSLSQSCVQRL